MQNRRIHRWDLQSQHLYNEELHSDKQIGFGMHYKC